MRALPPCALLGIILLLPGFAVAQDGPLAQPANRTSANRGVAVQAAPPQVAAELPGEAEMREVRDALDDLRGLANTLRNRSMTQEMKRKLDRVDRRLADLDVLRWDLIDSAAAYEAEALTCSQALDQALDRQRAIRRQRPPPRERYREAWYPEPEPPGPATTTQADLANIRRAIDGASFRDDKLATLRSASRDRWFTCAQVITLMGEFSFGKDQVEAAAMLHPNVVDPNNWFSVYAALTFDKDRRDLRRRVGD